MLCCAAVQLGLPLEASVPQAYDAARGDMPLVPESPHPRAPESPRARAGDLSALGPHYFVRLRRARRYLLRVDEDGRARVTIPRGGSQREASAFASRHVEWVARQRQRLADVRRAGDSASTIDRVALRARARVELPPRLLELAHVHGLKVARISIRSQRTRWGSCGRDGHITLNWRLVLMPDWVRDYVLVHELMHLRRLDHSPKYWALVAAACPVYREARAWLRAHGPSLR